jgi:hypothetical protein
MCEHLFLEMPYRILCNGTEQKSPEARPEQGLAPSHFTPLHKIRYGIFLEAEILEKERTS